MWVSVFMRKKYKKYLIVIFLSILVVFVFCFGNTSKERETDSLRNDKRLALVVVNGGSWKIINHLIERNELPNIEYMVDHGVSSKAKSIPTLKYSKKLSGPVNIERDFDTKANWSIQEGWEETSVGIYNGIIVNNSFKMKEGKTLAHYKKNFRGIEADKIEVLSSIPEPEKSKVRLKIKTSDNPHFLSLKDKATFELKDGQFEKKLNMNWGKFIFFKVILERNSLSVKSPWIGSIKVKGGYSETGISNESYDGKPNKYSSFKDNFEVMEESVQWASIATGSKPEKHGVWNFHSTSRTYKVNALWDIFHREGLDIGLLNWLTTWPPLKYDDYLVPGWPPEKSTYPKYLESKFDGISTHVKRKHFEDVKNDHNKWRLYKGLVSLKRVRKKYDYLEDKYNSKVLMLGFFGADHIQHEMWHCFRPNKYNIKENVKDCRRHIFEYYRELDDFMGGINEDYDSVILTSDHGFKQNEPVSKIYFFKVNTFLEDLGVLENSSSINFDQTKIYTTFNGLHNEVVSHKNHTEVYSEVRDLYVNPEGRRENGIVKKENYDKTISNFIDTVRGLDLKNSKNFFEVKRKKYANRFGRGGDITFTLNNNFKEAIKNNLSEIYFNYNGTLYSLSKYFDIFRHMGTHDHSSSLLIMSGEGFRENKKLSDTSIMDVAPTVLYYFNISRPAYMDGKVLKKAFNDKIIK